MFAHFLILLLLFTTSLFANITIDDNKVRYDKFSIKYLYDKSTNLTIDDIQNRQFTDTTLNSFTFGYRDGVTWFKLEIENLSNKEDYILTFSEAIWKSFDLYYLKDGIFIKELNGLDIPLSERSISDVTPAFSINIEKNATKVLYIKGQTIASQIGQFEIMTDKEYYNPSKISTVDIYIIFAFVLMSIIILNAYSYLLTKDNTYIYYILYAFASILFSAMHSGSYLILGFNGWSEGLHVIGTFVILFLLLFSDKFLNLKNKLPLIHKFFMLSAVMFLVFALLIYNNIAYSSMLFNIYSALFFVVLFFAVIKVFLQGYITAKYYLIALLIYAPLMGLMIATFNTFVDYSYLNRHAFLAGTLVEIIFFTLILTSKYRSVNLEKIRIQEELLYEKNKNEEFLEREILKRTKEIELQNQKFKAIYNTSRDGLVLLDMDLNYLEVNEAYANMIGYSVEELLSMNCLDTTPEEDVEETMATVQKIKDDGYVTDYEKRCIRKDGSIITVSMSTSLMSDKETMLASVKDITKQKKLINNLEESQEKLKLLASTDSLTHLYNRRYFSEMSESILDFSKRNKADLSVLMLDIDRFKKINDSYGHKTGDEVIKAVASTLQKFSRKSDIVCRCGGEEFVILLPDTNIEGAAIIANKMRELVENLSVDIENSSALKFTVSIGVSQVNTELDENIEVSIHKADKALYEAKDLGRNRVVVKRD